MNTLAQIARLRLGAPVCGWCLRDGVFETQLSRSGNWTSTKLYKCWAGCCRAEMGKCRRCVIRFHQLPLPTTSKRVGRYTFSQQCAQCAIARGWMVPV